MRYLLLALLPFALLTGAQAATAPKQNKDHNVAASTREASMKTAIKAHKPINLKKYPAPTNRK